MARRTCRRGVLAALLSAVVASIAAAQGPPLEQSPDLFGPLRGRPRNTMDAGFLVPELESPATLPHGAWRFRTGIDYYSASLSKLEKGDFVEYDADLYENWYEFSYGIRDDVEISARIGAGELLEGDPDTITIFSGATPLLGSTDRGFNLTDLTLKVKWELLGAHPEHDLFGFALIAGAKIPLSGQHDMLNSGAVDVSFGGVAQYAIHRVNIFADLGVTVTGDQDIFETDFRTDDLVYFGAGVNAAINPHLAVALQVQGNTPGFTEVEPLNTIPVTVSGGILTDFFGPLLQISGGVGLSDTAPDFFGGIQVSYVFGH
jgi:hypothetical protein